MRINFLTNILVAGALLGGLQLSFANERTPIADLEIPDKALKSCVERVAKEYRYKYGSDIKKLECIKGDVSDLTGLGQLSSLSDIRFRDQRISDLSPIQDLPKLIRLWISSNRAPLSFDKIAKKFNLKELRIRRSSIRTFKGIEYAQNLLKMQVNRNLVLGGLESLGELKSLDHLDLSGCNLDDVSPLRNLISLKYLMLDENSIVDTSPLSHLTHLTYLGLFDNLVEDVSPLSKLKELKSLSLSYNQIKTGLPFLKILPKLTSVYLVGNKNLDCVEAVEFAGHFPRGGVRLPWHCL